MTGHYFLHLLIFLTTVTTRCVTASPPPIRGGYFPSWSIVPPSAIDTSLFTHVFYAFLIPNNETFRFDIPDSTFFTLYNFTGTLRHKYPPVKTLYSVGGGGGDPNLFARMASNKKSRRAFIDSSIQVARRLVFDGIDLDWEFPESPAQMNNFASLLSEWRAQIHLEARKTGRKPLLLTAAVYFAADFFLASKPNYRKYPAASINKNLDFINVMNYDYRGSWDTSETGAHALFFDPKSNISSSYGLGSWVRAGVRPTKVVMGLPLYGKTWQLKDPAVHGIGAPAVGVGPGDGGILTFSQVETYNKRNKATVVYDKDTVSTYSYAGTAWIGYDDVTSTTAKIGLAKARGLGGYFFWAISYDREWKISGEASKAWNHYN